MLRLVETFVRQMLPLGFWVHVDGALVQIVRRVTHEQLYIGAETAHIRILSFPYWRKRLQVLAVASLRPFV